jgi:hypothetical protein
MPEANMTTKISVTRGAVALSCGLLLLGASGAAEAAPKRLGVLTFRGPGEATTRKAVMKAAQTNHHQVVGGQQISKTAGRLGVTLDTNDAFKAVAKELAISAFVTGEVTSKKATLTVRNGADGSVSAEAGWSGPNPRGLSAAVSKNFWRRLGASIERGKPPTGAKQGAVPDEDVAAAAPEDTDPERVETKSLSRSTSKKTVTEADEAPASDLEPRKKRKLAAEDGAAEGEASVSKKAEPEEEETGARPTYLDVSAGPRVMTRSLTYNQDIYNRNSRYSLPAGPAVALAADFYPAAMSMGGFLANVGVTADVAYLIPVVTTPAPTGTGNYETTSLAWSAGLKVRLPLGLFVSGSYGDQHYQLKPKDNATGVDVPTVDYRYIRGGAGIRHQATPQLALIVDVAYLQCLSLGQIGQAPYYKDATARALDAGIAVGYRINHTFELRAGADIRRYGLAFHQKASDFPATVNTDPTIRIAGGATDQYLSGWVAIAMLMGGETGEGGGAAARAHGDTEEETSASTTTEKSSSKSDSSDDQEDKPAPKKRKPKVDE